ncbi:MAG: hypothetical protein KDC53_23985, partial [Saprospiraceae bacterium]|nr:hypothetical protein [Saprospiraceae bacterium]
MKHLSLGICTDLFLLVLCFNYSVSSQNDLLRFKSYNLPEKTPILDCIYEDSQGFLWFGTYGGLYRYDGYEFEHFTHDPDNGKSLGDNKVRCLLEDDWGNLLIGTQVGLYVLDLGSRIFHQVTGMDTQTVHVMIKGEEGDFWVVCEEGIFKVRVDDIKREYDILKSWNIHSAATACLSDKGDFYFSDGEKLYVIDTSNQLDLIPVLSRKAYHGERINTVDIDSEGNFWMTSELGIHSYSIEFDSLLQFVPWPNPGLPGFLIGMLEYKKGHFLINTMHGLMDFNSINSSFRDVLIDGRSSIESEERLVPTYVMCLSKTGKIFLSL